RYQHRHTGEVRYIYHGNDGTHLPWNDTVQFNYLLPEMREAMIQLIIRVARRFRIIRFDAAMTLAKRHFQRLWYPLPGAAGGVPSRSDHALSQQDFNRYFPIEFWRELVDRVQLEAPDTLLVAEAFWLMEGYFVRTLGMHRVYNSAFMNMLMQEENAKYRQTIKNILVFDPAILQRFVNFMSNPDEEPAIEQFGDGDKYFCVATMLATMPGLPMFGHGQIEGLREKYGMEYLAPRWDEPVDKPLLERHRVSIFPLLRQRALFSGAEAFQLYDFESVYGVEEDVFVYSNQLEERRVLVICNNSSKSIVGRIGAPVAMAGRVGRDVATACAVDCSGDFVVMSDLTDNVQYLQPAASLRQGGDFSLKPYSSRVIAAFTAHQDKDERWQRLWQRHGDRAVRRLWLEHDGLLLEKSWPLLTELLALPQPQRARRQIRQLLIELESIYTAPPLAGMAKDYILEVQTHQRYPDLVLEHEGYGDLAWYLDRADTDDGWFRLFDRICNQHRLRPLLGCHYYDYYDWCVHQDLERFSLLLLGYQLFRERDRLAVEPVAMVDRTIEILRAIAKLQRQAAKVGYRVDQLLAQLDPRPPLDKPLAAQADGLKVLFVASEATPFAKSGGLADVAGSLPRALRLLGHDVQVVIPGYPQIDKAPVIPRKAPQSVEITLEGVPRRASLKQAVYDGVPYWFIDTPDLYQRDGLYSGPDGDYPDNGMRFGFFCRALLELARTLNFPPDVIHLHDWQTGLVPVLLKTSYAGDPFFAHTKTLLTVHNLGYHGTFPFSLLRQLELAGNLTSPAALEYYGNLSLLKGGIVFSDLVNTVSPTYCREIQTVEQGYGLDGLLRERSAHLHGILNGLDEQIWNPAQDSALPHNYSPRQLKNKQKCKALLQQELGLEVRADVPLVVLISRLDRQKGINLIESIWPQLLERPLQFALLGSGTPENMRFWQDRQGLSPGQVSINLTFNEGLSRRLYAAADMLLVPSLYEPCGLTQMIALKYGALPLVRRTGGLADTVVDVDDQPAGGNGFVFDHSDPWLLLATIDRALSHYHQPEAWAKLVKRGMMQDFSWAPSAQEYLKLYRYMIGLAADQEATGG
ncbi:MAG TPA: glycogen synthase GlgA, partial [Pelovirga sp.]|nr:glycogen synthase GlgA [Pelovirga sp.]